MSTSSTPGPDAARTETMTVREAIRAAMREEMTRDDDVFVMARTSACSAGLRRHSTGSSTSSTRRGSETRRSAKRGSSVQVSVRLRRAPARCRGHVLGLPRRFADHRPDLGRREDEDLGHAFLQGFLHGPLMRRCDIGMEQRHDHAVYLLGPDCIGDRLDLAVVERRVLAAVGETRPEMPWMRSRGISGSGRVQKREYMSGMRVGQVR